MRTLMASIVLLGFSSVAFAGNTIGPRGCWVPDSADAKTAHWADPCPGAVGPFNPGKRVAAPGGTSQGAVPSGMPKEAAPVGTRKAAPPIATRPTPASEPSQLSGDPLKGLNVTKSKGCWVPDGKDAKTAHWVDPCSQ